MKELVLSKTMNICRGTVTIPSLGLGTYKILEPESIYKAIINYDYRLIDSAPAYENEDIVG